MSNKLVLLFRRVWGITLLLILSAAGARALNAYTCSDCTADAWGCIATEDTLTCYYDYGTVKVVRQKAP